VALYGVAWSFLSCVVFCRSLFVLLSFLFWPLYCLSFFHLRLLIFLWYLQTLHSWLITGCVRRAKRRVPLVEQELLTHSVHTRYLVGFVLLDRFLIFCVVFWKIIVCPFVLFSFGLCSICPSSTYVFRLPHWYLQTFLKKLSFIDYSWYLWILYRFNYLPTSTWTENSRLEK
jgi:hypothetical protein